MKLNTKKIDILLLRREMQNGAEQEWRSSSFETFKECCDWAKDKVRKAGWQISYIKH